MGARSFTSRLPVFSPESTGFASRRLPVPATAYALSRLGRLRAALWITCTWRSVVSSGEPAGRRIFTVNSPCESWGISSVPRSGQDERRDGEQAERREQHGRAARQRPVEQRRVVPVEHAVALLRDPDERREHHREQLAEQSEHDAQHAHQQRDAKRSNQPSKRSAPANARIQGTLTNAGAPRRPRPDRAHGRRAR